jgi:hypothetical protein
VGTTTLHKAMVCGLALITATALAVACSPAGSGKTGDSGGGGGSASGKDSGPFIVARTADLDLVDPARATAFPTVQTLGLVYSAPGNKFPTRRSIRTPARCRTPFRYPIRKPKRCERLRPWPAMCRTPHARRRDAGSTRDVRTRKRSATSPIPCCGRWMSGWRPVTSPNAWDIEKANGGCCPEVCAASGGRPSDGCLRGTLRQ